MGQKVHPTGFRLGVTQPHHSNWFVSFKQYSTLVQEDRSIRHCIYEHVRKHVRTSSNHGGISSVKIQKKPDLVQVQIHTVFPAMLVANHGKSSTKLAAHGLEQLRHNVQDTLLIRNRKLKIAVAEVDRPYEEAMILAQYIALQLESRVAFRKTLKKAMELATQKGGVNGVRLQIAGRLNGAEIARVEWIRRGRVPLHTLRAQIDYCDYSAKTVYGVLGIKVWVFQHR